MGGGSPHLRLVRSRWRRLRLTVLHRDRYRCQKCGLAGRLECHHVVPLEAGGSNTVGNLATWCRPCHIAHHQGERLGEERLAWRAFAAGSVSTK